MRHVPGLGYVSEREGRFWICCVGENLGGF